MEKIPMNQDNDLKYYDGLEAFKKNQNPKIKNYKSITDDVVKDNNDEEEKLEYFTE